MKMVSMTQSWPEQSVYYIKEGIYMNMILVSLKQKKNVKIVSNWHFNDIYTEVLYGCTQ